VNDYRNPAFLGAKFDAITKELKRLRCSCVEPRPSRTRVLGQALTLILVAVLSANVGILICLATFSPQPHVQYAPKTWMNPIWHGGDLLLHQAEKRHMLDVRACENRGDVWIDHECHHGECANGCY
jgi:hypothetical protein